MLLLSVLAAAFLAGVFAWRALEEQQADVLSESAARDKTVFAQKILALRGRTLETLAVDYTYWDELVQFLRTRDKKWAAQNLDTSLDTYKACGVWVYDRQKSPVYRVHGPDVRHPDLLRVPLSGACDLLRKRPFCHFFLTTPDGLLEIHGASIHPTADPKRRGPHYGYFFTARLWDQASLQEVAALTGCAVTLRPPQQAPRLAGGNVAQGRIAFSLPLAGRDGKSVADLHFESGSHIVEVIRRSTGRAITLFIVFTVLLLALLFACLLRWVSTPLSLLSNCLQTHDPAALTSLHRQNTEFGELARLVWVFFDQKRALGEAHDLLETRRAEELSQANATLRWELAERGRVEEALRQSKQRFESLVRNASDVITILDAEGRLRYISPAALRVWGYPSEKLQGEDTFDLVHPDDVDTARTLFEQACGNPGINITSELRLRHADHSWRSCEVILNNLLAEPGVGGIVVTYRDITEREQLAHRAFHDPLSGLPNRALFMDRLEHALARAQRQQVPVAVIFLDLDNFKIINDSLGHEAGDQLLIAVTRRLQACVRRGDTVARLGGDEFTILVEELSDVGDVTRVAHRILEQLQAPVRLQGREIFPTGSIGIAISAEGCDQADALMRDADTAMYQAKTGGKAGYAVFDRSMNLGAMERMELEADLRRAIDRGELRLHYQPIVLLGTGRVREVEVLARWEHPERGLIPPIKFIPIAEETGLIVPLGNWILEEACRQARSWQEQYPGDPPLLISVNVSSRQLQQADLVQQVARILRETGLDPASLKLEITESVMMLNAETTIDKLHQLKELGVRLAIDDFGTGYSSMAYLSSLPIDPLKIDRSFVQKLGQQAED